MSASLLFNSDDDGTQNAVGDLEDTIKFSRHFRRYFAGHVDVVALNQVVDRVRKTALAPLVNTGQSAVSLHDTLEFFHESRAALVEKFKGIVEAHGTLTSVDEWGKRRLAYPINDLVEGYYVYMTCEVTPEMPAELDRVFKITDGILRSIIVAVEE